MAAPLFQRDIEVVSRMAQPLQGVSCTNRKDHTPMIDLLIAIAFSLVVVAPAYLSTARASHMPTAA